MTGKLLKTAMLAAALSTPAAFAITITPGNAGGNGGTDNVLFNDGSLSHSGTLVQGNFNGSGAGFVIDFTSASGSQLIAGSGGQATITGGLGNDPFTQLTFGLEGGATFANAILNPDASGNGTIDFIVNYIDAAGSPFTLQQSLSGNGQNFFHIDADGTERITSISFSTGDTSFVDASQFRLGGFARPVTTPDGGATIALSGMALLAMSGLRAKFRK